MKIADSSTWRCSIFSPLRLSDCSISNVKVGRPLGFSQSWLIQNIDMSLCEQGYDWVYLCNYIVPTLLYCYYHFNVESILQYNKESLLRFGELSLIIQNWGMLSLDFWKYCLTLLDDEQCTSVQFDEQTFLPFT